jgi:predicted acyl esterase
MPPASTSGRKARAGRWAATPLYLGADGSAGFARPSGAGHRLCQRSGPPRAVHPAPDRHGHAAQWKPWLVHDQRFVSGRPDVAEWQTAALDKPVHIMGAPEVDLYAATTGTDSDWVVKLIDVYPNDVPEPPIRAVARRWRAMNCRSGSRSSGAAMPRALPGPPRSSRGR